MKRVREFDFMKWWPLLLFVAASIGTYAVLFYRVDQLEKQNEKKNEWLKGNSVAIADLRERCARMEGR